MAVIARLLDALAYRAPGERRACPACASSRVIHLEPLALRRAVDGRRAGFVSGCEACGLVFANPIPSREELDAFYAPGGEWTERRQGLADETEGVSRRYLEELFGPVRQTFDVFAPPPGASVLDVGCGEGELLNTLQDIGWRTFGIEPATKVPFARHTELTELPAEPQFHLAVLHHVLEHVDSPLDLLRRVRRSLVPGGHLFVSVPRLDALPVHADLSYCISPRSHVLSYTGDCMTTLFARAGFRVAAALNPPVSDRQAAGRAVRRLRMLGVAVDGRVPPPARPLDAARRAFAAYHAAHGRLDGIERVMPVRLRAARLNDDLLAGRARASRAEESRRQYDRARSRFRQTREQLVAARRQLRGARAKLRAAREATARWRHAAKRRAPQVPSEAVLAGVLPAHVGRAQQRAAAAGVVERERRFASVSASYRDAIARVAETVRGRTASQINGLAWVEPAGTAAALVLPYREILESRRFALGGTMIDVGAGTGAASIPRVVLGDASCCYCAESDAGLYECLVANIVSNRLTGLVLPDRASIGGAITIDDWIARVGANPCDVTLVRVGSHDVREILSGADRLLAHRHITWDLTLAGASVSDAARLDALARLVAPAFQYFIDIGPGAQASSERPTREFSEALAYVHATGAQTQILLFNTARR